MIQRIMISCIASTTLILFSTQAFALINFSVGIPLSQTFTKLEDSDGNKVKPESVSGTFIQVGVPILPGIGMDNIESNFGDSKIATTIYNLYYLLPIPVINLTLGAGVGSTEFKCEGCSSLYDKGATSQWYTSFGFPIIPLFDLHLSYRSINAKVKGKGLAEGAEVDFSSNVMGLGIGVNF